MILFHNVNKIKNIICLKRTLRIFLKKMKFYKMLILSLYMKQCSVYSIIVKKEQLKIHI